ncbi:MAG: hypothetical protein AAFU77_17290 [Myxococcota bacterium]
MRKESNPALREIRAVLDERFTRSEASALMRYFGLGSAKPLNRAELARKLCGKKTQSYVRSQLRGVKWSKLKQLKRALDHCARQRALTTVKAAQAVTNAGIPISATGLTRLLESFGPGAPVIAGVVLNRRVVYAPGKKAAARAAVRDESRAKSAERQKDVRDELAAERRQEAHRLLSPKSPRAEVLTLSEAEARFKLSRPTLYAARQSNRLKTVNVEGLHYCLAKDVLDFKKKRPRAAVGESNGFLARQLRERYAALAALASAPKKIKLELAVSLLGLAPSELRRIYTSETAALPVDQLAKRLAELAPGAHERVKVSRLTVLSITEATRRVPAPRHVLKEAIDSSELPIWPGLRGAMLLTKDLVAWWNKRSGKKK